jgi:hypothetical protein
MEPPLPPSFLPTQAGLVTFKDSELDLPLRQEKECLCQAKMYLLCVWIRTFRVKGELGIHLVQISNFIHRDLSHQEVKKVDQGHTAEKL